MDNIEEIQKRLLASGVGVGWVDSVAFAGYTQVSISYNGKFFGMTVKTDDYNHWLVLESSLKELTK